MSSAKQGFLLMRPFVSGLIFGFVLFLSFSQALLGAEIIIPGVVNTSKAAVTLGDVARINGGDPAWKDVVLAYLSGPGSELELQGEYIKARLKLSGIPIEKLSLQIPKTVRIKREAIRISRKDLEAIAKRCILENDPWGKALKIQELRAANDLLLPKGKLAYFCQLFTSPLGSFSVPIVFKVDKEITSRVRVMAKTSLVTPVVISVYPIRRGEIISRDKIQAVKRDLSRLPAGLFTRPEELIGKRARRAIGANQIIYKNMVEIPPVIRRGQRVEIVAESPTLKITAPGKAKEDGHIGEIVKVENLISRKIVVGKVIDETRVEVEF